MKKIKKLKNAQKRENCDFFKKLDFLDHFYLFFRKKIFSKFFGKKKFFFENFQKFVWDQNFFQNLKKIFSGLIFVRLRRAWGQSIERSHTSSLKKT